MDLFHFPSMRMRKILDAQKFLLRKSLDSSNNGLLKKSRWPATFIKMKKMFPLQNCCLKKASVRGLKNFLVVLPQGTNDRVGIGEVHLLEVELISGGGG